MERKFLMRKERKKFGLFYALGGYGRDVAMLFIFAGLGNWLILCLVTNNHSIDSLPFATVLAHVINEGI